MDAHPDDIRDATDLADLVRCEGGAEYDDEPDPVTIARAIGVDVLEVPSDRLGGSPGALTWQRGGYTIEVDALLDLAAKQGTIAHELGHAACKLWNVIPRAWERFAWVFAGALLIPSGSLDLTWREAGDLRAFVDRWPHVPPTLAALSLGERGRASVHVVQDYAIRYSRGAAAENVVQLGVHAWLHGNARERGAQAIRLVDARRRAAVLLAA